MTRALIDGVLQSPGVRQLMGRVFRDLEMRRSVLLLLPGGPVGQELAPVLEGELRRRHIDLESVPLAAIMDGPNPAVALGKHLEVTWRPMDAPRNAYHLARTEGLPKIILLSGGGAKETWGSNLVDMFRLWAQGSRAVEEEEGLASALCAVAVVGDPSVSVPRSDVNLSVHWWWQVLSSLEMRLLCRDGSGILDFASAWRECVLPSLASGDPFLVEHLWEHPDFCREELMDYLCAYAQIHGWAKGELLSSGRDDIDSLNSRARHWSEDNPPPAHQELWCRGLLAWTPEHGVELHSAVLALLGRWDDIRHRLWRGQTPLLLPLLDDIRIRICRHLDQHHGKWFLHPRPPLTEEECEAVVENSLSCQWGHLHFVLRESAYLRTEYRWLPLVDKARSIRNELAHYRPISYEDYKGLMLEAQRLGIV